MGLCYVRLKRTYYIGLDLPLACVWCENIIPSFGMSHAIVAMAICEVQLCNMHHINCVDGGQLHGNCMGESL